MSKQITRQPTKQERRRERREEQKRREVERLRATARRRQITVVSIIAAVVIIAAASLFFYLNGRNNTSNVPSTPVNALYPAVDNVSCDVGEQTAYHIHAHLTIYINGQPVQVPQGIGIASDSSCLYWLHTHNTDGVIHIEAPTNHNFTLANFLHLWGDQFQSLSYPSQLASTEGWTIYACHATSCQTITGDFSKVKLDAHLLITMVYNSPGVKPVTDFAWNGL